MNEDYVLITPAHNEEANIERLVHSVIAQTILPKKWIILDDASTDRTGEIMARYDSQHDFIISRRLNRREIPSYYIRRTLVVLQGYEELKKLEFDFLGVLDADITVKPTYYEQLLTEFDRNLKLGVASGIYLDEINGRLRKVPQAEISTPGGLHMFRRKCYEEIGGYVALEYGGDDSLADIMSRMHGWQTRSFPQYPAIHHRAMGTGGGIGVLHGKFRQGLAEYQFGTHPVFMLAKTLRRFYRERPYLLASAARMTGYLYAHLKREKRQVPDEVVSFYRREQIQRLLVSVRGS